MVANYIWIKGDTIFFQLQVDFYNLSLYLEALFFFVEGEELISRSG